MLKEDLIFLGTNLDYSLMQHECEDMVDVAWQGSKAIDKIFTK